MRQPIDHTARAELVAQQRTLREHIEGLCQAVAECREDAALHDLPPALSALLSRVLDAADAVCDVAEGR